MISKVRDYITAGISALDSSLTRWSSPIDSENIPETRADGIYSIKYELNSSELGQQIVADIVDTEIQFLFKGFRDEENTYDEKMDLVNSIRVSLLNLHNIEAFADTDLSPIASIESSSITGDVINGNKRQLLITLSVSFLIHQTIC